MVKRNLLLVFILLCYAGSFAQKSTIVLCRGSKKGCDKFFVHAWIGTTSLDSIPANDAVFFKIKDEDFVNIRCQIENYASWPSTRLKISVIDKDTSFFRIDIKRDPFGNPNVKLTLMPRTEGLAYLSPGMRRASSDDEDENEHTDQPLRSGTGFLVSNSGLVITNFHVIEDAKTITVKNIGGNKDSSLTATVLIKDEGNDLAVLKVGSGNLTFDNVPYVIKNSQCDLGEKIMVFGYPITSKMGSDVKLTNGIISSINGYKGDANSYQVSAAIQPGNSGGPVFDEKGNLVAVINAKLMNAENASYCIKSSYLFTMLQGSSDYKAPNQNAELWKMSLTEQAKILQRLVYIIEIK